MSEATHFADYTLVEGVGVAYHPFLQKMLLADSDAYSFIELPLDRYIDPAQQALIDPQFSRLDRLVSTKPCIWRGSSLSLGSVDLPNAFIEKQISELMDRAHTGVYCDEIAFRRIGACDLGLPQAIPHTLSTAEWVARRYNAARQSLGRPFMLSLPASALIAADSCPAATTFLSYLSDRTDCSFALELCDGCLDPPRSLSRETILRLPAHRIRQISMTGETAALWDLLDSLLAETAARSVVIRRQKNMFPLDAIIADMRRASALLNRSSVRGPGERVPPILARDGKHLAAMTDSLDEISPELAALRVQQAAFVDSCFKTEAATEPSAAVGSFRDDPAFRPNRVPEIATLRSRLVWQERVNDLHKADQLSRWLSKPKNRGFR